MRTVATDIVVIGAGPTGLAAAWRLSTGGARVLCIEQGHYFEPPSMQPDAPTFASAKRGALHPNPMVRQNEADYPIDYAGCAIAPMIGNAVNGGTNYWAAHVPRYRPDDFRTHSLDGVGTDWPFDYSALEPYYDLYEAKAGAAYRPGAPDLPERPAPARVLPPPYPGAERLDKVFSDLGWEAWSVDLALGPDLGPTPSCSHAGPCDIGCPAWRGALASEGFLPEALDSGLELMTRTRAVRITHDASGRVTGVICRRAGEELHIRADKVVLAGNGIATPWLMQVSRSERFPNGIGNSHDQLGRGMMLHPYAWVRGYVEGLPARAPGPASSIICTQFRPSAPGSGAKRGIRMQSADESRRPKPVGAPEGNWLGISICAEDLAEQHNRITLSETLLTAEGLPAPKMEYRVSQDSRRLLDFGIDRAREALAAMGAKSMEVETLITDGGFHIMGTARMGNDPATSVVDSIGRCHDAPDLIVVDASVFVTGSAMNPTATAAAFALRAADHILVAQHG
jgi:choline dehydrogenase-like flavoprotein